MPADSEKIEVWTTRIESAASARGESKSGKRGFPVGGETSGTGLGYQRLPALGRNLQRRAGHQVPLAASGAVREALPCIEVRRDCS